MGLIKPSTKAYFATAGCLILIVINIGLFVFLPKSAAPLWVVISNVITVFIMLLAVKPISALKDKEIDEKALARAREEEALRGRIASLESENRELASRLDTYSQSAGVPSSVNFTFKVETMTYDKSGYIVKEEPLEKFLEDPAYKISDKSRLSKWMDSLTHPGDRKVLYIGKYYAKASIGLDFTKIKYSVRGNSLAFAGVTFTKLNDLAIQKSPDDVNHCWLLNEGEDTVSINQSGLYKEFTAEYAKVRADEATAALADEVNNLCGHYTTVFRNKLSERFPLIEFCDDIENTTDTWYSLADHGRDSRVLNIASNMLLMADVMSGSLTSDNQ